MLARTRKQHWDPFSFFHLCELASVSGSAGSAMTSTVAAVSELQLP